MVMVLSMDSLEMRKFGTLTKNVQSLLRPYCFEGPFVSVVRSPSFRQIKAYIHGYKRTLGAFEIIKFNWIVYCMLFWYT